MPDQQLLPSVYAAADKYHIPRDLFAALIAQESGFNPRAVGPVTKSGEQARGLGQLMPGTASALGVSDPFDPHQNLDASARYFAQQLRQFNDENLALAAYNAGPKAVMKYGMVPPYPETQDYVARIQARRIHYGTGGMAPTASLPPPVPEKPNFLTGIPSTPAAAAAPKKAQYLTDVPSTPSPPAAATPKAPQYLTDVPSTASTAPSARTAGLAGAPLSPALGGGTIAEHSPQMHAGMEIRPSTGSVDKLGGLFPAHADLPAQVATTFRAAYKADDAVHAAATTVAKHLHDEGDGALFNPKVWHHAGTNFQNALTDIEHSTPPTAVRQYLGLKPGKANRLAYDAAFVADYLLSWEYDPSSLLGSTVGEALGPAIKAGVVRATRPLVNATERAIATHAPVLAEKASLIGQNLGVGKAAAQLREVTTPLRLELSNRLVGAQQIAREAAAATVALRKASPAFDAAERSYAQANGGNSRLNALIGEYVTRDLGGNPAAATHDPATQYGLRQAAQQFGLPWAKVEELGNRLIAHANETGGTLEGHAMVPPGSLTTAGPERTQYLHHYTDRLFGLPPGTTAGSATPGAIAAHGLEDVERAARGNMLASLAADPQLSAPVVAGQPLRPGWVELPADPAYGSAAGLSVPQSIATYVKNAINPARQVGNPGSLQKLGATVNRAWLTGVRGAKQLTLTLNPAGLVSSTGARVAASEIALKRSRVPVARLAQEFPAAAQEWWHFLRTGEQSPAIRELTERTPAFLSHYATQIGEPGAAGMAQRAGTGGSIFRVGSGSVYLPPARQTFGNFMSSGGYSHGALDQLVKLALYKSLKPKLGPAAAAEQVTKHLFDFSDQPALLELANKYGIMPFNAYPVKATHLLFHTLTERPDLILRYPRLQAMLMADIPNAKKDYENVPSFAHGPMTLPIGSGNFANLQRYLPFGEQLTAGQELLHPEYRPGGQTPVDKLLTHVLPGPAIGALGMNRDIRTGRPIAPPGTPPGQALPQQLGFALQAAKPSLIRGAERIGAALQGRTVSPSRYGEPQTLAASLSQSLLNAPIYRGEDQAAKEQRLGSAIEQRGEVAGAFVDQLDVALDARQPGFPERAEYERAAASMSPIGVKPELNKVRSLLHTTIMDPTIMDPKGRLTEEGQAKLRRLVTWLHALGDRLDAMPEP